MREMAMPWGAPWAREARCAAGTRCERGMRWKSWNTRLQADLKEHTICSTIRIAPIAMTKTSRRAVLYPSLWFGNHTFNRYASLPFR